MSAHALSASLLSSLALVAMLGFRHGLDADHIAVVDGMTRARRLHHSYSTSRLVGMAFAMSFDALAQAAFFASRGSDRLARQASRFASGFIALIALFTAGAVLLRGLAAGFAQAWDDMGLWIRVGLLVLTSLGCTARIAVQRARLARTVPVR